MGFNLKIMTNIESQVGAIMSKDKVGDDLKS